MTENTKFELDLDNENFVKKSKEAEEAIKKVGEAENLKGLLTVLEEMGPAIAIIAITILALKESWEAVFNAENIAAINKQFEIFTEMAGVSTEKLKEGFEIAADGWATEADLMQSANKAMLSLSSGIERLPELMELARKSALVMGGTMTDQFDLLARSIAAGNQRGLRQAGIIVDIQKAYREYAVSVGTTVSALSQAEKQQALLNTVLETGGEKLSGVNADIKPVTNAWTQFKVAVSETTEVLEIFTAKTIGPTMANAFKSMRTSMADLKDYILANFGNESEKTAAKVNILERSIEKTKKAIDEINSGKGIGATLAPTDKVSWLKQYNEDLSRYQDHLEKLKKTTQDVRAAESGSAGPKGDPIARAKAEAEAQKQLQEIKSKVVAEEKKDITSVEQADNYGSLQRIQRARQVEAQIAEVRAKSASGEISSGNATAQIKQLEHLKMLVLIRDEKELRAERERALDNDLAKSRNTFEGIGRGFEAMSSKNQLMLKDFGKIGENTSQSFAKHMSGAFRAIGDGSKSATEALGSAFEGMVGEMASQYGEMMFLASIFPPNPAGLAAGLALMTLGGMLSGAAGGGSTSSVGSSGAGYSPALDSGSALAQSSSQTQQTKSVVVAFNAPILNNEQTARWLTDQIRNASDATAFTIQSVDGGFGG